MPILPHLTRLVYNRRGITIVRILAFVLIILLATLSPWIPTIIDNALYQELCIPNHIRVLSVCTGIYLWIFFTICIFTPKYI